MSTTLKRFVSLFAVAGTFAVLAQLTLTASAMCVYNYTDTEIYARYDCGIVCRNDWDLEPGESQCRPNKSGTLSTGYYQNAYTVILPAVKLAVEAHGWVEMKTVGFGDVQVCAYRQDRSQSKCVTYEPQTNG